MSVSTLFLMDKFELRYAAPYCRGGSFPPYIYETESLARIPPWAHCAKNDLLETGGHFSFPIPVAGGRWLVGSCTRCGPAVAPLSRTTLTCWSVSRPGRCAPAFGGASRTASGQALDARQSPARMSLAGWQRVRIEPIDAKQCQAMPPTEAVSSCGKYRIS